MNSVIEQGAQTPADIVDELTYLSYQHNRRKISAERLGRIFPAHKELEARYQRELRDPQPQKAA